MSMRRVFFSTYLPLFLWMGFIFFLSSQSHLPGPTQSWLNFLLHKIAHIIVYAVLYLLMYRAVNFGRISKNWMLPIILSLLYAGSDEIHQVFVTGRTPAFRDVGYDGLGMIIVMLRIYRFI